MKTDKVKLIKFTEKSITPEYVSWLNDQEVNRYLDTGRIPVSFDDVFAPRDDKNLMFMVMTNMYYDEYGDIQTDTDYVKYIGTCSLHKIDWIVRKCEIGYMIGNKKFWGLGIASDVVKVLSDYAFSRLNMNKITAGVVGDNSGSKKVLEKNGFVLNSVEPQDYFLDKYLDTFRYYKMRAG